jgi:hypothetical protein
MQQVEVGFEGDGTAELRYCIVLLVAIHQHCEIQNQQNVLVTLIYRVERSHEKNE